MSEGIDGAVERVMAVAIAASGPKEMGDENHLGVLIPAGYRFEQVDTERYQRQPRRMVGNIKLASAISFAQFVNRYKTILTAVYHYPANSRIVAVFNDHSASEPERFDEDGVWTGAPNWRDHTATFDCPLSPEWRTWTGSDKQPKNQAQFAEFVEQNLPDIFSPDSATMLEVSRNMQAKKDVSFGSSTNLSNGAVNFRYKEEVQGSIRDGQMEIPTRFTIRIPVFVGGPAYDIDANLRYRVDGNGKLSMWYELVRPQKSLEHAFDQTVAFVQKHVNPHEYMVTEKAQDNDELVRTAPAPKLTVPFFAAVQ